MRALKTAKAIHATQPSSSTVPLHTNELLREQYFGAAEGKSFKTKRNKDMTLAEHFARGLFPALYNRTERFPGGESRDDVATRAQRFLDEVLMPYVWQEDTGKADSPIHIVVVSHGLFIPELIVLMARKDDVHKAKNEAEIRSNARGMRNTAWTRVEFGFQVRLERDIRNAAVEILTYMRQRVEPQNQGSDDSDVQTPEKALRLKFLNVKVHPHLHNLVRNREVTAKL
ncbi:hypothetical protein EST38_g1396 [Candolleomyces aberdarensis]|uniref:Phosphoglycerate mutase n=1 Tax=Candolleomyces aberdarensis TaxID=2316362 RepID=A0A4Q2DW65_9AGAR|nr:hypothetical protein EST38_g1396 [Candolleomyces aberdarensis]